MKKVQMIVSVLALGLLLAAVVSWGQAGAPSPSEESLPFQDERDTSWVTDVVSRTLPIQGRLTDANGAPLHGNYNMTFRLYSDETGGAEFCTETALVYVDRGLFDASVDSCHYGAVHGQPVWLGVEVESDGEMTPAPAIEPGPIRAVLTTRGRDTCRPTRSKCAHG